jgi:hypothetical protein
MIEEKIKLNSKLIVVDAFKSGQKQNETPVYDHHYHQNNESQCFHN